jgi:PAS domain S-box-containing protein
MPELTDTLPVAVYTTDVAGTITHFNEAAASLWGRRPVLGVDRWCGSWQLFWTDGTPLPHEQCPMAVALKENRPVRGLEAVALRPDGSHVIFAPYPTPLHDQDGELVGAVNVLVDITGRKAAEDGLTAARMDLERRVQDSATQLVQARKMEAVGQITCGMAHDFNNVLQGVGSCLAALEEHVAGDRGRELLAAARQGIERGGWLTRGLLAFARHEALPPRPTAMSAVLEGLRGILECSMGSLIHVETWIADDVWPVLVDPTQLELALINLAINARDAMPSGGALTITATNRPVEIADPATAALDGPMSLASGDYVAVTVTDTGTGMDAETLAHACEAFFTTKGPGKGSGLGLSMVRDMATQSGGDLRVSSERGRGTTVTIYLPRAVSASREPTHQPAETVRAGREAVVLLVDDDDLVRAGASAVLEALGHQVLGADSGAEALAILQGSAMVDILVTDYAMPGMSGAALIREVHHLMPDLPVLVMTGLERPEGLDRASCIQKPFQALELAARLAALLPEEAPAGAVKRTTKTESM